MSINSKPKILIYLPDISQDWGGVRQYSALLINTLEVLHDKYTFYILFENDDSFIKSLIDSKPYFIKLNRESIKTNNLIIIYSKFVYLINKILKKIWNSRILFEYPSKLDILVDKYSIDIIHCPYQYLPNVSNARLVTTIHDVQELHYPEFFTPELRANRANSYLDYIRRADSVVVSYEHVKLDIIKYFQIEASKINVTLLNMSNLWFSKLSVKDFDPCFDDYDFKSFLLYPANFWYHKNHKQLIDVIYFLKLKGVFVNIIFTGDDKTPLGLEMKGYVIELNLESQIKFLGIVEERLLYTLYKKSIGVVIPTLYEAGSFPLYECIFLEVPVICSNVTSLPETIGNVDFLFDPCDLEDIAQKISMLWENDDFRSASLFNSSQQKSKLLEINASKILIEIYNKIILQ